MDPQLTNDTYEVREQVSGVELNSWRRGFTPQAEIWNGRMAMAAIVFGLFFLLILNSNFIG